MSDTTPTTLETAGAPSTPDTSSTPDAIDTLDVSAWLADDSVGVTGPATTPIGDEPAAEPEPEAAEEPEAKADAGPERDEHGRFTKKAEEAPEGEAPKAEPRPFQYRAAGQTKPWDGVTEDAEGNITVPAAKAGELRAALNARELVEGQYAPTIERHKQEITTLRAQLQQREQAQSAEVARANALVNSIMSIAQMPDEVQSLEAFYQLRQSLPTLLLKAENEMLRAQRAPQARPETAPRAPEPPALHALPAPEEARATTMEYVEHAKLDQEYRDVTADDWKQYAARIERSPMAFIRPATAEEAQEYGVAPGQPVFDTDAYEADVREFVQTVRSQRETAATIAERAKQQARLAAENARRTQPAVKAPPAVGGSKAPGGTTRPIRTAADVDAWIDSITAD
jgi:hypothetical protein